MITSLRHLLLLSSAVTALSIVSLLSPASATDNGLALTPQMGWNSWNHFKCSINEDVIYGIGQAMISSGLHQHGYEYVNIDDCWADHRDSFNRTIPDAKLFPSGMFALGEKIHALGLKFGIYSDAGTETCVGKPGGLGYEVIDALTYAAWGVDYLKYDNCNNKGIKSPLRYKPMHDALNATGRPILFSICDWQDSAAYWAPPLGNSWRTTDDINTGWSSVMRNLIENDAYWEVAAPGQWNDPDMLEVGNGLTYDESVSHFSLWCLVKSPLILGNDIRNMTADTLSILTNNEVIALNQDPLGIQGHLVSTTNGFDVWAGPLQDGSIGVVLFNRNDTQTADVITARWKDIGLPEGTKATVRDLWKRAERGSFAGSYSVKGLKPRQSVTVRITPVNGGVRQEVVRQAVRGRNAARRAKYAGCNDPPIQDDPRLTDYNLDERVALFIDTANEQAAHNRGENLLWNLGFDFNFEAAHEWYKNVDKLIAAVNANGTVHAMYSTPSIYVAAKKAETNLTWPLKTDDLFPYASRPHEFWTGYFTSRPALKRYVRAASAQLQVLRQLEIIVEPDLFNSFHLCRDEGDRVY